MGISLVDGKMEGWLYLIRSNRLGLQNFKRRYIILYTNSLSCYKFVPTSRTQSPVRNTPIDSCTRVMDNGRENIHKNDFYVFTLYNAANHIDPLKLGARSSEEAARWIRSITDTALQLQELPNKGENFVPCSRRRKQPHRLNTKERARTSSIDWTGLLSPRSYPMSSDVIAPSPWTIFGCKNGLRFFKEARDGNSHGKWDDNQALMAVGVVDATSEAIFQTVMSLGPSRSEWDFCFSRGGVVEHLDSHTDVIHKKFSDDLIPWGMKRRDLLLQRYWRREDDGTYVILYQSVFHPKCHPERGCIRAYLKSGGFVITPVNQGKQSVVKHMMAVDWRVWRPIIFSSSAKFMTMQMLGRVAALREFFRAKIGNCIFANVSSVELTREIGLLQCETEDIKMEVQSLGETGKCADSSEETSNSPSKHANMNVSIPRRNDVVEEFFDVPDESEYDLDSTWPSDAKMLSQDKCHSLPTTAVFVHRLQDLTVERSNSIDSLDTRIGNMVTCRYGTTLPNDSSCASPCTWATADPSSFLIRGQTYLQNNQKVKATSTLMKLVGADWLSSDKREDDLGGRPGSIVQEYAARGGSEFFFIVNIQVPGSTTYNLAFYYMMDTPLETIPLLKSFVKGDDAYRNSRFKLIPYISKGSWIVKQSVGKKACLVGQGLRINYFSGKNYLEVGIDVGSSTVARGVVSLVLGYLNNLVIELAFLIQGNTQEELPEVLLGTCLVNHLDASRAVPVN
ncbi:Bet v1-like protein [Dioscorea alata]|uniref:Bet v1-like protein n=1 Tax=Dioscorea alata TaxID=55571 RepID=A0ACB7UPL7_DIOAL|nr:Bet v1-like protein [Dioscorea alata]